ncbi:MAG TPA: HAD family hydrolase [Candidatus Limnocylindrales bacterium]|nr:HAD family hydrolase [Candidatus Limnocylindrales bacterium]
MTTHLLFDFFGTLVDHSSQRRDPGYPRTRAALDRLGLAMTGEELAASWEETWFPFEERSQVDHREFSMIDVGTVFLRSLLGREPDPAVTRELMDVYIGEWDSGVTYLDGLGDWLSELSHDYRLAIVSNVHEAHLVPSHLEKMGLKNRFDAVILSVEVGWRKPHPEIYATALKTLGAQADQAVFVGDTHAADFLGPERAGIKSFLIDPHDRAGVPAGRRLDTVFDLSTRLQL